MKIYENKPEYLVRLQISRVGEETQYLTLHETTPQEVEEVCKMLIEGKHLSIFQTGHRTRIDIREAVGAKNGKSKSISFRGLSAKDTLDTILNHINNIS